ncbi:hypothetical protein BH10ACT11_BH10ACT11_02180 [soil metagenome]
MPGRCLNGVRTNRIGIAVAIGVVALSLPNGGYYPRATAIATLVAWWIVLVGCASGVLPRVRVGRAALAFVALLGGYAIWMAFSLIWSPDVGRGFINVVRASGYVGLAAVVVFTSRAEAARQWLGGLAVGATVVIGLALVSRYFPTLLDSGRDEIATTFSSALGRLAYPLGYWNAIGGLASLDLLLLAGFAANGKNRRLRAVASGLIALPTLALLLTSSRGGILVAIAGAAFILIAAEHRERWILASLPGFTMGAVLVAIANGRDSFTGDLGGDLATSQGRSMFLFSLIAVAAAGIVAYGLDPAVRKLRLPSLPGRGVAVGFVVVAVVVGFALDAPERFDRLRAPPQASDLVGPNLGNESSSGRWQYWSTAAHAFADDPVKGVGSGSYPNFWDKNGAIAIPSKNAHSLPMETLAELGVVGALLLLGFALLPLLVGVVRLRRERSPELVLALALYVALALDASIDWAWQVPALFGVGIVVAGVLLSENGAGDPAVSVAERTQALPSSGPLRVAALIAAVAAITVAGFQLVGQTKIDAASSALDNGDAVKALADSRDAASVEPWSAQARLLQASALEASGRYGPARTAIAAAIDRAPQDWIAWLIAARIEEMAGNRAAAAEAGEQMLHLNPAIPSTEDGG